MADYFIVIRIDGTAAQAEAAAAAACTAVLAEGATVTYAYKSEAGVAGTVEDVA